MDSQDLCTKNEKKGVYSKVIQYTTRHIQNK